MAHPLTRDMDFIRDLLLKIEAGDRLFETMSDDLSSTLGDEPTGLSDADASKLENHLRLLEDAGFVEFKRGSGGHWFADRITWSGHEFLDAARDPEMWKRAKAGAAKAGNASLGFVWEIAKAFGKQAAAEKLGLLIP